MRRRVVGLLLLGTLLVSGLLVAGVGLSYSDGYAGGSGAVPERFRECQGQEFCKFKPSYCGTCHGSPDDMWNREDPGTPSPQERIKTTLWVDNDDKAGTADGTWEYTPGQAYRLDIRIEDRHSEKRPPGTYAQGGFNLNASAGTLSKLRDNDNTVRITGGLFEHSGSENPDLVDARSGRPLGSPEEDESNWAGEATHTGSRTTSSGNDRQFWSVRWTAPTRSAEPFGVAFVMSAMIPNGDGWMSCTYQNCNQSQGPSPQDQWDWYSFMIPRRIMCEEGFYDSYLDCRRAVEKFILPRSPPLNTSCGPDNPAACETQEPRGSPAPPSATLILVVAALALAFRRRPPRGLAKPTVY